MADRRKHTKAIKDMQSLSSQKTLQNLRLQLQLEPLEIEINNSTAPSTTMSPPHTNNPTPPPKPNTAPSKYTPPTIKQTPQFSKTYKKEMIRAWQSSNGF